MGSLVFFSQGEALEGQLLTAHREAGEVCVFFNVRTGRFYSISDGLDTPWINFSPGTTRNLRSTFFSKLSSEMGLERLFALGLEASEYAVRVSGSRVHIILSRGELDFSSRRKHLVERFSRIASKAEGLFLEDAWEMDKAVGHGSQVPHFIHPSTTVEGERVLARYLDVPHLAVILPEQGGGAKEHALASALEAASERIGGRVTAFAADRLYKDSDLYSGRGLAGTLRYRLGACSHVVMLGDSRNHAPLFAALAEDSSRVFVENTFNSHYMYNSDFARRNAGRGAALIDRVLEGMTSGGSGGDVPFRFADGSAYLERFDSVASASWSPDYEEIPGLDDRESFNVYFLSAGIENRSDGARPQRIRNMAIAMESYGPSIRLSPHPAVMKRRLRLIESLASDGYGVDFLYGENTTTPMADYDRIAGTSRLMAYLKSIDVPIAWFVRDLHWLSSDVEQSSSGVAYETMKARGVHELESVALWADRFFAPSARAISGFKRLLGKDVLSRVVWEALPPGVSDDNCLLESSELRSEEGVTYVYTGGMGGLYEMESLFASLDGIRVPDRCYLDFVIRPEDEDYLRHRLSGIDVSAFMEVRISTDGFEGYRPRTKAAVGFVLLDKEYATFAFPYKVMSYLEKAIPVLAFSDSAVAHHIVHAGVGRVVDRDVSVLRDELRGASEWLLPSLLTGRQENSWNCRVDQVARALGLGDRA